MKTDALKRTKRTGSTIVKILALFVFWQLCVLDVHAQIIEVSVSHYFVGRCRPQDSSYYRDYDGNNFLPETDFVVTIDEDKKEILIGGRDNDIIAGGIFFSSPYEEYNSYAISPSYNGHFTVPSEIYVDCVDPSSQGWYKVVDINAYAFYNIRGLKSIKMHCKHLRLIEQNAFDADTKYNSVQSVDIKTDQALTIETNAFANTMMNLNGSGDYSNYVNTSRNCLQTVTIKSAGLTVQPRAFIGCEGLKKVDIQSSGIINIGESAFAAIGYKVTNGSTQIEYSNLPALWNSTSQDYIRITGPVNTIAERAFAGHVNIKEVKINDSRTNNDTGDMTIGQYAFENLFDGSSADGIIDIRGPITTISNYAFRPESRFVNKTSPLIPSGQSYTSCVKSIQIRNTGTKNLTIGQYAFSELFSVNSPESQPGEIIITGAVESIANYAFYKPTYTKSININNTGSTALTIGTHAFEYPFQCKGNYGGTLQIAGNLKSIGQYSFAGGYALNNTTINNTGSQDLTIDDYAFCDTYSYNYNGITPNAGTLNIKGRIAKIGKSAFSYNRISNYTYGNLQTLSINNTGNTEMTIGDMAFRQQYNRSGSGSCSIGGKLSSIGKEAFMNTNYLVTLTINTTSKFAINDDCFANSVRLSKLNSNNGQTTPTLPATVAYVGNRAFRNTGFTEITFPILSLPASKNPTITSTNPMRQVQLTKGGSTTKVPSSNAVHDEYNINSNFGNNVFANCANLTSATVNSTATGVGVFSGCTKLNNVTLGSTVKFIEAQSFEGCTSLKRLFVPRNVEVVGASIMRNGANPHRITFENPQPPYAFKNAFNGNNPNIVVPTGCVSSYLFSSNDGGFQNVANDNISCEYTVPSSGWGTLGMQAHNIIEFGCDESDNKITRLEINGSKQRGTFTDVYDVRRIGVADAGNIATNTTTNINIYTADCYYPRNGKVGIDKIQNGPVVPTNTSTSSRHIGYLVEGEGSKTYYLHHYTGGNMNSTASTAHTYAGYQTLREAAKTTFDGEVIPRPSVFEGGTYGRKVAPNLLMAFIGTVYTQGQNFAIDNGEYYGTQECYFYGLAGGRFRKIAGWSNFREGNAFIAIPKNLIDSTNPELFSGANELLGFFIANETESDDDMPTGIYGSTSSVDDNAGWYTINGVKLDKRPTKRGIYIHNGRKEAVK